MPVLNRLVRDPQFDVGIVSRNFTLTPGKTIRTVLANSGVTEKYLDFIIPVPVGARKVDVLEGMRSSRYRRCILGADEVGDYKAAMEAGYEAYMVSYGFDSGKRLMEKGGVGPEQIFDSPAAWIHNMEQQLICLHYSPA